MRGSTMFCAVCDLEGTIERVARNDLELPVGSGDCLSTIFDPAHETKVRLFLASARADGVTDVWELHVYRDRERVVMSIVGLKEGNRLIIVGFSGAVSDVGAIERLMAVHNEQTNTLRQAMRAMRGTR